MSEPEKKPHDESQTTFLHLSKFAPKKPGQPPTNTSPEESPTLFIQKAAAETAEQSSQPVVVPKGGALPPKEMLGAVTYCYAKGVYRSEDIERKMKQDPEFRSAVQNEIPDAHAIRRFRRLNRAAIQATLEKFFRKLRKRPPLTQVMPGAQPPEPSPLPPSAPAASDAGNTTMLAKREASARLDNAAWIDNMSKEE